MPYLVAVNGLDSGRLIELTQGESVLGRNPDCDVVIEVGAVSRQHCKFYRQGKTYWLEDLQSRNGTYLNGQIIDRPHELCDRDQITICDVIYLFHFFEPPRIPLARAVMVDDEQSSTTINGQLDATSSLHHHTAVSAETKLSALIEIMINLGRALSLDEVLPQLLGSLFNIFTQADRGFIGLLDEDQTVVPRWTKFRHDADQAAIRVSRTLAERVLESRQAILSADPSSDPRFEVSQSIAADFRGRSVMSAPLLAGDGAAVGILQIDTADPVRQFREEDLELLVSTAAQAAVAIDNARMHDEDLARKSLERDLNLAHEVQNAFLPAGPAKVPGYGFFDFYQPASWLGGDYYDYLPLADGRLAVVVADVVGHGIAAAMLMAKLSAEARFCIANVDLPEAAVSQLNNRLCMLSIERFVTLILVVLDPQSDRASVVNAGHLPAFHRQSHGEVADVGADTGGIPLGIERDTVYRRTDIELSPGESLSLLTDGLYEATNEDRQMFGLQRIRQCISGCASDSQALGNSLLKEVHQHLDGRPQEDDMCLVILQKTQ